MDHFKECLRFALKLVFIPTAQFYFMLDEARMCHNSVLADKSSLHLARRLYSITIGDGLQFREGEAPAEPWHCKLGRSLALPPTNLQDS